MLRAQAHAFEVNLLKLITAQLGDASCTALDGLLDLPSAQYADTSPASESANGFSRLAERCRPHQSRNIAPGIG